MLAVAACQTPGGGIDSGLPLSDRPLIGKFVWHDLITDDVAAARRFYGGLFGWSFEDSQRPGGGAYTLIKSRGNYIGGMLQLGDPGDGRDYTRWLGYLSVADVDAAANQVQAAGGSVLAAPHELGRIARAAAVEDPQGAVVGLVRSHVGDPHDAIAAGPGRVVWDELLAADDSAAGAFYGSLAGYQVETVQRRGGHYTLLNADGRQRAGILQRPNDGIEPQWLTYFAVEDPVAASTQAAALGGKILLAPSADLREGSMALVEDPNGAVLALQKWPR